MMKLRPTHSTDSTRDEGFTLIELLVSMAILSVLFTIVIAATTSMFRDLRKSTGVTDSVEQSRRVVTLLDKQIRYANGITLPGVVGTASFVEWKTGVTGQRQTCTQWRFTPSTKKLEYRSWQPILNTGDVLGTTAWSRASGAVVAPATGAVFELTNTAEGLTRVATDGGTVARNQTLKVSFTTVNGSPSARNDTSVSFTALNTTSPLVPTGICTEVARS